MIDDGFEALLEPFYNGKKLTDPISTKEDKFQLLPAFLKVKGALSPAMPHREPLENIANKYLQASLNSTPRHQAQQQGAFR